jgi:hypothetical protein
MEKRKEGNLKMEFILCKGWRNVWKLHSRKYNMKSTESKSSFKTIMKSKEEFHETNQLKKESKEMNSKVKVPRLQETKVFVTQKSKSNQDGTQHGILQKRERWKKKHGKRIRKQEIQNWTSNLLDFNNTLKVARKTPQRITDLTMEKKPEEEDGPEEKKEEEDTHKKEDRPREEEERRR